MPDDFQTVMGQGRTFMETFRAEAPKAAWTKVEDENLTEHNAVSHMASTATWNATIAKFPLHDTTAYRGMVVTKQGLVMPLDPHDVEQLYQIIK